MTASITASETAREKTKCSATGEAIESGENREGLIGGLLEFSVD